MGWPGGEGCEGGLRSGIAFGAGRGWRGGGWLRMPLSLSVVRDLWIEGP